MKNSKFDIDLKYGQLVEGNIRQILTLPAGDVGQVKFEIKSDRQAHQTGNLFVEYASRGERTGPFYSTSEWWVIDFAGFQGPGNMPRVLAFLERQWFLERLRFLYSKGHLLKIDGGDNLSSRGGLVKIENLFTDRWIR